MKNILTRRPTRKIFKQFYEGGKEDLDEWRKIFVETCDPTEYKAAIALVGSWKEWQRFKREWSKFEGILEEWKLEQEVYIRSQAVAKIVEDASGNGKSAASSAKWLAEGKYNHRSAGRPSKAQIAREIKIQTGIENEIDDDVERVLNFAES